jgi:hypothetical protein
MEHFLSIMNKRKSFFLYNTFFAFVFGIIVFEAFFSFVGYYFSYNSYMTRVRSQMIIEANRIEVSLQDMFSETEGIMTYIGRQISLHSEKDPNFIEKILSNSPEIASKTKDIYPWTLFDWVDPNSYRVINSKFGRIQDTPMKVVDSYAWKCPKNPWVLQISHPNIGNTSGMWVIPAGLGILNEHDKYLGTLNVSFNVAALNSKIQQNLASKGASFVILDDNLRIVLQSADNAIDPKSSYYKDILSDKKEFTEEKNYLSIPIFYKNIKYTYYKKIKGYPYIILTGFDTLLTEQEFWILFLPQLLELYGVGAFCLCLLYLLRKNIFKLKTTSENYKKTFLNRINLEMKESIDTIIAYSNILKKNIKNEIEIIVTNERKIEFIEKIYEEALNLHSIVGKTLNNTYISIHEMINDAISILIETALENDIKFKTSVENALPLFYGDELRLKQILVGLLSLSMNYSPKKSTIKISATHQISSEGKMFLVIRIKDNGFILNGEDMMRISDKFSYENKESGWEGNLDFASIEVSC